MERASLIGSAYKRRALVDGAAGRRARVQQDLRQMQRQLSGCAEGRARRAAPPTSTTRRESSGRRCGAARRHARWRSLDRETATHPRARASRPRAPPTRTSGASSAKPSWTSTRRWRRGSSRRLASSCPGPTRICTSASPPPGCGRRCTTRRAWCCRTTRAARRGKERAAANELLAQLRSFAHPDEAE